MLHFWIQTSKLLVEKFNSGALNLGSIGIEILSSGRN